MNTQPIKGQRIVGEERTRLGHKLATRYRQGATIRQLVNLTGRSYGFVHRVLIEAGVSMRNRGGDRRTRRPQ